MQSNIYKLTKKLWHRLPVGMRRIYLNMKYHLFLAFRYYIVDGHIESQIARWIGQYVEPGNNILEVGLGDGRLIKYIPNGSKYVGLDLDPCVRAIRPLLGHRRLAIIADAKAIPLPLHWADVIVSMECLEHVRGYRAALAEIRRVARPYAILLVSIPNNYCYKYAIKGPHPDHVNNWTYQEFVKELDAIGFRVVQGKMSGIWIPLFPRWRWSPQLRLSHRREYYNSNFLFVFQRLQDPEPHI